MKWVIFLFFIMLFTAIANAGNITLEIPDIYFNESFNITIVAENVSGIYDVKVDILDINGSRVGKIWNGNDWQSTFYYLNDAWNINGTGNYTVKLIVMENVKTVNITGKIRADDDSVISSINYIKNLSINETKYRNIVIKTISFFPPNPKDGNDINITATLYNNITENRAVEVKFYNYSVSDENLIAIRNISIHSNKSNSSKVTWKKVPAGNHTIFVVFISGDKTGNISKNIFVSEIVEKNETILLEIPEIYANVPFYINLTLSKFSFDLYDVKVFIKNIKREIISETWNGSDWQSSFYYLPDIVNINRLNYTYQVKLKTSYADFATIIARVRNEKNETFDSIEYIITIKPESEYKPVQINQSMNETHEKQTTNQTLGTTEAKEIKEAGKGITGKAVDSEGVVAYLLIIIIIVLVAYIIYKKRFRKFNYIYRAKRFW